MRLLILLFFPFILNAQDTVRYNFSSDEKTLIIHDQRDKIIEFTGTLDAKTTGKDVEPGHTQTAHKWPRTRSHIRIVNCHNIKLINPRVNGPHAKGGTSNDAYIAAFEAQHGIEIESSTGITIQGGEIANVFGDIVYIRASRDVVIDGLTGHHNGRQGIAIVNAQNIEIKNSHFYEIRRALIDLENNSSSEVVDGVVIHNNRFGRKRLKFIASAGVGTVKNVFVLDNDLYAAPFDCIIGRSDGRGQFKNFVFSGNVSKAIFGNPQMQMSKFYFVDFVYIGGNEIMAQPGRKMNIAGSYGSNVLLGENKVLNGKNEVK